jgi:hypothetical protein
MHWWPATAGPDRMVFRAGGWDLCAVWSPERDQEASNPLGETAYFPPNVTELIVYSDVNAWHTRRVWNREHPVVAAVTRDAAHWCDINLPSNLDPLSVAEALLLDRSRAAWWLSRVIVDVKSDLWEAIADRDPDFLASLWKLVFALGDVPESEWPSIKGWVVEREAAFELRGTKWDERNPEEGLCWVFGVDGRNLPPEWTLTAAHEGDWVRVWGQS